MLAGQRPAIGGGVGSANELSFFRFRRAGWFVDTAAAVPTGSAVILEVAAIQILIEALERQFLASGAGIAIGIGIVRKYLCISFILTEDRNSGRDAPGFEQSVVYTIRVIGIGRYFPYWQLLRS